MSDDGTLGSYRMVGDRRRHRQSHQKALETDTSPLSSHSCSATFLHARVAKS